MYKVLLVEDDPVCSSSINNLLTEFCQLHITSSAAIALNLATANKYNLVMIDVNIASGNSGLGIANSISNISNYDSIPIVAFAITRLAESKEYFLSRGYTHLIHEPFNKRNFAQQIKFLLSSQLSSNSSILLPLKKNPVSKLVY